MTIPVGDIQRLREATGAGVMDAKKALQASGGDYARAIDFLKKQGQKVAARKVERQTKEGTIGAYLHANGKVAALVVLACESDFVAKTDDFKTLAHELAMQVAATSPLYSAPSDVPEAVINEEKEAYREQLKKEKKPEKIQEKIIAGKLDKYFSEVCLLRQPYIKEEKKTVEQLIQENVLKLGENIQVREFKRVTL